MSVFNLVLYSQAWRHVVVSPLPALFFIRQCHMLWQPRLINKCVWQISCKHKLIKQLDGDKRCLKRFIRAQFEKWTIRLKTKISRFSCWCNSSVISSTSSLDRKKNVEKMEDSIVLMISQHHNHSCPISEANIRSDFELKYLDKVENINRSTNIQLCSTEYPERCL